MSATGLLVFARCAGFAFRAPGLAHPSVPPAVRAGMAALLAIAIAPGTRAAAAVDGIALVVALGSEFLLGTAIGIAASLVYDAAYAGGRAVDDYTGVKAIAPSAQLVAPSGFGRIWSLAFTGAYFLLGVYRFTLLGVRAEFRSRSARRRVRRERVGRVCALAREHRVRRRRCRRRTGDRAFVRRARRDRRAVAGDPAIRQLYAGLSARLRRGADRDRAGACRR